MCSTRRRAKIVIEPELVFWCPVHDEVTGKGKRTDLVEWFSG